MLDQLLGGFVNKEKVTKETIKNALEDVAEELKCKPESFWIMIKPVNEKFEFKCYIYHTPEGEKTPKLVREITVKEIVGNESIT